MLVLVVVFDLVHEAHDVLVEEVDEVLVEDAETEDQSTQGHSSHDHVEEAGVVCIPVTQSVTPSQASALWSFILESLCQLQDEEVAFVDEDHLDHVSVHVESHPVLSQLSLFHVVSSGCREDDAITPSSWAMSPTNGAASAVSTDSRVSSSWTCGRSAVLLASLSRRYCEQAKLDAIVH